MIEHVVMWKLKDEFRPRTSAAGQEALRAMTAALTGLRDRIETIKGLDLGTDCLGEENWDLVLKLRLDSLDALAAYQKHPAHLAVVPIIQSHVQSRACVDYPLS